jgi:hypothetical protein
MGSTPKQNIHAANEVTEDMPNAKRKSEEELMRELDERDDVLVGVEDGVAEWVKEMFPEVKTPHVNLGVIMRKTLLYYHGKYYDIEEYAKLVSRMDDEALERGEYKRWTRERVEGAQKIVREVAKRVVEDLKAGRLKEWADAWIMEGKGPLIA